MASRKEQILDAAMKRFGHYGYSKTTMNEIADDLQIAKANLYYYYPDKNALFVDVVREISNQIHDNEKKIIAQYKGDLLSTLFELIEFRSSWMKKFYRLHINESQEVIRCSGLFEVIQEYQECCIAELASLFKKAIATGELKLSAPEGAARMYSESMKGVALNHNLNQYVNKTPYEYKVEDILDNQKALTELIFEGKINSK